MLLRRVAILAAFVVLAFAAGAQTPPPPPPPGAGATAPAPIPQDLLDSLLAPIALYPDELLTQILMASTYPLEVVEAARFVKANPNLRGAALDDALKDKTWDPSVLSLTSFPQVLDMMNDKLDWTQQLGDAFLQDQAAVMNTVQSLRLRAQQAGNLQSTPQEQVVAQDGDISIQPAQPQYVYVPVYNPVVIYGPWWAPEYTPWFWYPPPIWGYPPYTGGALVVGFVWGAAWAITVNNWGWCRPNWRGRSVNITIVRNNIWVNRPRYRDEYGGGGGGWKHDVEHRRGVAYRDTVTRDKYRPSDRGAVQTRENYRGRDNTARPGPAGSGGNASRPVTAEGGNASRPARGGAEKVARPGGTVSRPATGSAENMARPEGGGGGTGSRPGGGGATRPSAPVPRPSAPESHPSTPAPRPSAPETRPMPAYQPEARSQVQREEARGAQSRAAAQRPAPAAPRAAPAAPRPAPAANRGNAGQRR